AAGVGPAGAEDRYATAGDGRAAASRRAPRAGDVAARRQAGSRGRHAARVDVAVRPDGWADGLLLRRAHTHRGRGRAGRLLVAGIGRWVGMVAPADAGCVLDLAHTSQ